jgi:beta-mannosidase
LVDGYFNTYSVTEQIAKMKYEAKVYSQTDADVLVKLTCNTNRNETDSTYSLKAGVNLIELPFEIQHPQLWWCNGQGHASLYSFEVKMLVQGKEHARQTDLIGLRDMRLITQPDSIGESFYFQLNGQPVFAKGANYIPMRYFPGEATEADYLKLIMQCKDAHINMLRVWGGGVYEDDVFYDLCDQYGIMIWHDFMFACSMYPGDAAFLENVRIEAEQQVRRLRNHACIAMWCGNNENAEGWERWGWKSGLSESQVEAVQKAYDDVFKKILPNMVSANSRTDYWESSPRLGRGDVRSIDQGDSHYWGVWHDAQPFEVLQAKVPRFMSEFGTQSYPSQEVVEEMMEGDEVSIRDEGIVQHQKHGRGFDLMDMYLNNWYPEVSKDEVALYGAMTQVVQAEGIAMGIEAQRRAMPRCMGTLYWQLNDVWPAFS